MVRDRTDIQRLLRSKCLIFRFHSAQLIRGWYSTPCFSSTVMRPRRYAALAFRRVEQSSRWHPRIATKYVGQ